MPDPTPEEMKLARKLACKPLICSVDPEETGHSVGCWGYTRRVAAAFAEQREQNGVGGRFTRVMERLRALGVSYRENYGGPFEYRFPHSAYFFTISTDRHQIVVKMIDGASDSEPVELAFRPPRRDNDLAAEIVEALEEAEATIKELKHDD